MKARRLLLAALVGAGLRAQAPEPPLPAAHLGLAREILAELVSTDTTGEHGDTTPAAEALARRLREAGFPAEDVRVLGPGPKHRNLVVRYRGRGKARPILLLDHLDVVEALRQDWTKEPFRLTEEEGWLYGRGTLDIKGEAAIQVATFIRLRREGYLPSRDLILALTAGEEGATGYDGVEWLLQQHRDLIDAEFCLNGDGGGVYAKGGRVQFRALQPSEKGFYTFELEVKDKGGHSSLPTATNPIHILAGGLDRLARQPFPLSLNEVNRAFFARMAAVEGGEVGRDMAALASREDAGAAARLCRDTYFNAQLRTTVVATQVSGGHAANALPQSARATLNCRLMPGEDVLAVQARVEALLADPRIHVRLLETPAPNPASPLRKDLLEALERTTARVWPGTPVIPTMDTGGSDATYLRPAGIPTYGISGIPLDKEDDRSHGQDERIAVKSFHEGLLAFELLIRELTR